MTGAIEHMNEREEQLHIRRNWIGVCVVVLLTLSLCVVW